MDIKSSTVEAIADRIGIAASEAWPVLIRFAELDAVGDLIVILVSISICALAVVITWKGLHEAYIEDRVKASILVGVVLFFASLFIGTVIETMTIRIMEPEGYMLTKLIEELS